jgi:small subunit ribosomal protein S16
VYNAERVQYWLSVGAQPTDRVSRFLEKANLVPVKTRNNPQKAVVGKKMTDRAEANAAKAAAGSAATAE